MASRLIIAGRGGPDAYSLDGQWVARVTSCVGVLEKPALYWWYANQAAIWAAENPDQLAALGEETFIKTATGAANRNRDQAALRGTALHAHAEKLVTTGEAPDVPEDQVPLVMQAADFLDSLQVETLASERAVFHDVFWYAGRLDLLAVIRDQLWLLDFKTGKGVYPDMALQQAAYRFATHMQSATGAEDEPMPPVAKVGIVHVRPEGWQLVPLNADREAWQAFLATLPLYQFTRRDPKDIVAAPLAAGKAKADA